MCVHVYRQDTCQPKRVATNQPTWLILRNAVCHGNTYTSDAHNRNSVSPPTWTTTPLTRVPLSALGCWIWVFESVLKIKQAQLHANYHRVKVLLAQPKMFSRFFHTFNLPTNQIPKRVKLFCATAHAIVTPESLYSKRS